MCRDDEKPLLGDFCAQNNFDTVVYVSRGVRQAIPIRQQAVPSVSHINMYVQTGLLLTSTLDCQRNSA